MARTITAQTFLKARKADFSVKIQLGIILFTLMLQMQFAKSASILVNLQKCSTQVLENAWIVPSWFQAPLSPEKIHVLLSSIGTGVQGQEEDTAQNVSSAAGRIFKYNLDLKETGELECSAHHKGVLDSSFQKSTLVLNRNSTAPTRINKTSKYYIMTNGYLRNNFYSIPPDNYCISSITTDELKIETCVQLPTATRTSTNKPDTIGSKFVLRKCCPLGQTAHMNLTNIKAPKCSEALGAQEWSPRIVTKMRGFTSDKYVGVNEPEKHKPYFYQKKMGCKNWGVLTPNTGVKYASLISELRILENGSVVARSDGNHPWDHPKNPQNEKIDHFCVDGLVNTGSRDYDLEDPKNEIYLYCNDKEQPKDVYEEMFFYMALVSSFILLVVVVIYGSIWSSQDIHGWTNASFSLSMLLNFVCFAIIHGLRLFHSSYNEFIANNSTICFCIGVIGHFCEIATFTWMTNLNFDLYTTIRSMTPLKNSSKRKLRFLGYCCFGFGIPILVVSVSLILETQFDLFDDRLFRPQYGHRDCSLDKSARSYYAVTPSTVLFTMNIIFAILTAKFLFDFKQGTKCLKNAQQNKKIRSQNAKLFLQLFVVMGFSWSFEIISWLVAGQDNYAWYWAIFDTYNILQAIGLFWIFVCKREVKDQLCSKYQSIDAIYKWINTLKQSKSTTGTTKSKSASYVTM